MCFLAIWICSFFDVNLHILPWFLLLRFCFSLWDFWSSFCILATGPLWNMCTVNVSCFHDLPLYTLYDVVWRTIYYWFYCSPSFSVLTLWLMYIVSFLRDICPQRRYFVYGIFLFFLSNHQLIIDLKTFVERPSLPHRILMLPCHKWIMWLCIDLLPSWTFEGTTNRLILPGVWLH